MFSAIRRTQLAYLLLLGLLLFLFAACDDSSDNPASGIASVSVNMRVNTTIAVAPAKTGANVTLTRVRLLLEEMELESVFEDSADFEVGPAVIDLDLSGQPTQIGNGSVPIGTYDELEFEIDNLDEDDEFDSEDPSFADFLGTDYSMIIEGLYNATSFTLNIDQDFEQETDLVPPLIIDSATTSANITMTIDVESWFLDQDGMPLDPGDPANLSIIKNNIANSFDAFEDNDNDGGLEFEGNVESVNPDAGSFVLQGAGEILISEMTTFEGDITSLGAVKELLDLGKEVEGEGEGFRSDDGLIIATEVKFEEEDED